MSFNRHQGQFNYLGHRERQHLVSYERNKVTFSSTQSQRVVPVKEPESVLDKTIETITKQILLKNPKLGQHSEILDVIAKKKITETINTLVTAHDIELLTIDIQKETLSQWNKRLLKFERKPEPKTEINSLRKIQEIYLKPQSTSLNGFSDEIDSDLKKKLRYSANILIKKSLLEQQQMKKNEFLKQKRQSSSEPVIQEKKINTKLKQLQEYQLNQVLQTKSLLEQQIKLKMQEQKNFMSAAQLHQDKLDVQRKEMRQINQQSLKKQILNDREAIMHKFESELSFDKNFLQTMKQPSKTIVSYLYRDEKPNQVKISNQQRICLQKRQVEIEIEDQENKKFLNKQEQDAKINFYESNQSDRQNVLSRQQKAQTIKKEQLTQILSRMQLRNQMMNEDQNWQEQFKLRDKKDRSIDQENIKNKRNVLIQMSKTQQQQIKDQSLRRQTDLVIF